MYSLAQSALNKPDEILANINSKLRNLRALVRSADLDWLSEFYSNGGFDPFLQTLTILSLQTEKYFKQASHSSVIVQSFASAIQECIATLRSLVNSPVSLVIYNYLYFFLFRLV